MSNMGNAMMGSGEAEGENRYVACLYALVRLQPSNGSLISADDRALRAAEDALANPLLGDISIKVRY